ETYRFLRLPRPEEEADEGGFPAGYVHLPHGITAEWIKQLTAEQLVTTKDRRGFQKLEWRQSRERNEALDCRVYRDRGRLSCRRARCGRSGSHHMARAGSDCG